MRTVLGAVGLCALAAVVGSHSNASTAAPSVGGVQLAMAPDPTASPGDLPTSRPSSLEVERVASEEVPPGHGPLVGLDGAATALASKDWARALSLLDASEPPDQGSETWFRVGAMKGRALRHLGQHEDAVSALEPLWKHKSLRRYFPPDVIGMELARAQIEWARTGTLETAAADAQRQAAVDILRRVQKMEPLRNYAEARVLQAEALLEVEGTSAAKTKAAARKALAAVGKILKEYPNHPRIGDLWLGQALAQERSGDVTAAAYSLRRIAIHRAGEPEADEAWRHLERLASEHRRISMKPFTVLEQLDRASAARGLRRVELSREILDELVDGGGAHAGLRQVAIRSRSFTAYKQRDFARCADDLRPMWKATGNGDVRDWLLRCLERGGMYEEAIDMWLQAADTKRKSAKAHAIWQAMALAVRAGLYERAWELLESYEKLSNGHRTERYWLHAWLPYRLGKTEEAIAAFEEVERFRGEKTRARYFRGKLLLQSKDAEQRELGASLLRGLAENEPLEYYGLMARQRLLDAGMTCPPVPPLPAMEDETWPPPRSEAQATFDRVDDAFGESWPPIRRARQLYAAGYLEEARREIRVAVEAYTTAGRKASGPRNESFVVGLGWKAEWRHPRVAPTKAGRKDLRDRAANAALGQDLRALARIVEEPYRYARLTDATAYPYKSRWHPRAYRAAIEREARLRKIDPIHLWSLMFTESRFRRFVVSPVGARGALQIMPWTATQLAQRLGELENDRFDTDQLFDIDTNAHLASYYIAELLHKFHGQAAMAYASYNGGPSNVSRWLAAKSRGSTPLELDTFIEEIPFRETYRYTRRVLEVAAAYNLMYRGELPRWTNEVDPVFEDNIDF